MEVTYEIVATVEAHLCSEYETFMRERHIPDLIATGSFVSATLERSRPGRYRVRYVTSSQEALDNYLEQHAPLLRSDFSRRFPTGIDVSREEWTLVEHFA